MMTSFYKAIFGLTLSVLPLGTTAWAASPRDGNSVVTLTRPARGAASADHSGRVRQGQAGVLNGVRLASGARLDPSAAVAASQVLPVGTTARVTNLDNGRVTMVQIRDRGPTGQGRLLDLSPGIARSIGLTNVANVQVAPLAVPQPDGSIRLGDGTGLSGQPAAPALSERPQDWG
ncbi:septal ring lytic transglycosylase RlpA family protein [Roseomonas sp. BN140053]|uniref:septal ring lytic transglycosylase RlpA family protein n=1 Tax=Roseomonas sp. BN140053 TaxID=3391898 RepID=UPI0039EA7B14